MFEVNNDHWQAWLNRWQTRYLRHIYDIGFDYLRNGNEMRIENGMRLMQVLILPSFKPAVSYELFFLHGAGPNHPDARYLLLKTSWDFEADFDRWKAEKPAELIPVFDHVTRGVDKNFASAVIDSFNVSIPAWFDLMAGFKTGNDGVVYELAFGRYFLNARYAWWGRSPDAWSPLQEAVQAAISKFEEVLSDEQETVE